MKTTVGGTAGLTIALERVYVTQSSNVFTRSSPGTFSLTSCLLIGSVCIHLRSHDVVRAWNTTSSECLYKGRLATEPANGWLLTEFMTEIFRIDNGRSKRIRRVDVLRVTSANVFLNGQLAAYHRAACERMLQSKVRLSYRDKKRWSIAHEMEDDRCRVGSIGAWRRRRSSCRKQK